MKMSLRKFARITLYVFLVIFLFLTVFVVYYFPGASAVDSKEEVGFLYKNNVIIVSAAINNSAPYNFILDTGTDPSVIDIDLASDLSLFQLPIGEQEVGENQPIEISIPLPMKLKVGGLPASRKLFLGLDIKKLSDKMEMPIHGILGHNFIQDNIMQIDYKRQILTFYPFGVDPYPNPSEDVKRMELFFIDDGAFPLTKSLLVNGKPIKATIDTGSNQTLTLFNASVDYLGLGDALANAKSFESLGYGGEHDIKTLDSLSLKIDDWDVLNSNVNFDLESKKAQVSLDLRGGNIGNKILQGYILTLDYLNSTVWFEKI